MLYGNFAGTIALLWTLEYALCLYTSMFLYPQTLASALFLSSLYVHLKVGRWGAGLRVLEGLLFGLLILTVPMYLFALPCVLILVAAESKSAWQVLVIFAWIALPLGLWTARNYSAFHSFVFIGTSGGRDLLLGNSSDTIVNAGGQADIRTYADEASRLSLNEVQTDIFYRRYAVDWMLQHPRKWLVLYAEKLLNWFNFRNDLATKAQGSNAKWILLFFTWYSLLAAAALRILFKADGWSCVDIYLWGVFASGALSYAIFFTRLRYRVPYDYILILQATACVKEFLKRRGLAARMV
jgi:hypothetical protein